MKISKKDEKEFEKWAIKYCQKVQKVLLLEHFYPIEMKHKPEEKNTYCSHEYPYQSIFIGYTTTVIKNFKENKMDQVKEVLVHEMVHPLTDPLYHVGFQRFVTDKQIENEREKLTDHIANIVLKNKLV